MIRFDSDSIFNRRTGKLQEDPNWKAIINNSVISTMIRSDSEADAELARFGEFLNKESRWDTAQNPSSVIAMSNMMGYQPKRKISATGKLYVSMDPKTWNVGTTIPLETFEGLKDSTNSSWRKPTENIIINSNCRITDSYGNNYIATTPGSLSDYYTSIDIMQGTRKSKYIDIDTIKNTYTRSRLNPYLYIPVRLDNCEAASTIISSQFLEVYVVYPKNTSTTGNNQSEDDFTYVPYRVVNSLLLSSEGDKDVELYNDLYNQNLFYLKFKDDPYTGDALDISASTSVAGIRVDYVESLGSLSNVSNRYRTFTLTQPKADGTRIRLYGINYTSISGGLDEEDISSIKKNATKEYIKYYSIGTKENYQNAILNTTFKVTDGSNNNFTITPSKVQVYRGYETDSGYKIPVTCVSFIGNGMDDLSSNSKVYEAIEQSLNYSLARLKSPQDTIRFQAPIYTSFALGITCSIDSRGTEEINSLSSSISNYIEEKWGPNSGDINFGRNFSLSEEITGLTTKFPSIKNLDIEVEATKKLDWNRANIMSPNGDEETKVHTRRIPFDFSTVFLGNQNIKGFRDYNTGSPYVMRFDFLYKSPLTMGNTSSLSKSLFIDSAAAPLESEDDAVRSKPGFYILHEGQLSEGTWPEVSDLINLSDYDELADCDNLKNSYMTDFKKKVYTDSEYLLLRNDFETGKVALRNNTSPGTVDNYLVYFSGDYTTEEGGDGNIGAGWLEISFDEIYSVLQTFSLYDTSLANRLSTCSLNALKCNKADADTFENFKNIMVDYLDIYVSMRPYDKNLSFESSSLSDERGQDGSNELLYIDSYDSEITEVSATGQRTTNLSADKKSRFISVDCSYK